MSREKVQLVVADASFVTYVARHRQLLMGRLATGTLAFAERISSKASRLARGARSEAKHIKTKKGNPLYLHAYNGYWTGSSSRSMCCKE